MYGAWDRGRTIVVSVALGLYFFRWGLLSLIGATIVGVWLLHE